MVSVCSAFGAKHTVAVSKYTIGFSQSADDRWRQIMMIQMESEVSKYSNINLIISEAHNDTETQIRQIREFIDRRVNLLIISPNESEPITQIAVEAYRKGIPTIIWDRKILSDEYTAYIGADNCSIGRSVGNYIRAHFPPGSSILEIQGLRGSSPAQERHKGFREVLKDDYHVRSIVGDWLPSATKSKVLDISDYSGIDLVFAHNDDMALAAYEGISERSPSDAKRIKFIGVDAIVGVDAVIDGRLEASFLYPPGGEFVIVTAMKILSGEPVEKNNTLRSFTVDATNAETLKTQSDQMLGYQEHINQQKKELDKLNTSYRSALTLFVLLVVIVLALLVVIVLAFVANSKVRKRNAELEALANQRIEQFTKPGADDLFKDRLLDIMERSYDKSDFTVESMSEALGMSRVHLYRKTQEIYGIAPTDLLRTFRLRKATAMLKRGGYTVSEVAYSVGFSTPGYFTKCFKEMFGVTPSEF